MSHSLLLTAILCALIGLALTATPKPPVYTKTLHIKTSGKIPVEGVNVEVTTAVDTVYNRSMTSYSTKNGWYSQILRNDLGFLFYVFYDNQQPECLVYNLEGGNMPVVLPQFDSFEFYRQDYVRGMLANVFVMDAGPYRTTVFVNAHSGDIIMVMNPGVMDGISGETSFFQSGQPLPDELFAVPPYCNYKNQTYFLSTGLQVPPPPPQQQMQLPRLKKFEKLRRTNKLLFAPINPVNHMPKNRNYGVHPEILQEVLEHAEQYPSHRYVRPSSQSLAAINSIFPNVLDNRVYATGIRSQGECGSCWAFSTSAAIEVARNYHSKIPSNKTAMEFLSPQSVIDCTHNMSHDKSLYTGARGCFGGSPLLALHLITKHGMARERDYPYEMVSGYACRLSPAKTTYPISDYKFLYKPPVTDLMSAIVEHGAFVVIINVIGSFIFHTTGIYDDPACTPGVSHAVTVVGFGTETVATTTTTVAGRVTAQEQPQKTETVDYWIVKNSWGATWGEGGYIRIRRGVNRCGIEVFGFVPVV